jgi:two-component system response regulator PilR (NtrC family)
MREQRLLLVEDDPAINELLALALREEGYVVDVAATAAEAKAALDGTRYAMLISDWRLPDGDGLQIADWAADKQIETVLITGYVLYMPRGRAERHEILTKPVRLSELLAAVERRIGAGRG